MFVSTDDHVIVVTALDGDNVAVSVVVSPMLTVREAGNPETLVGSGAFTVTSHQSDFPLDVFTQILVVPTETPLTVQDNPEYETVAILVLLEDHVIVVTAFDGVNVAVSVMVSPILTV